MYRTDFRPEYDSLEGFDRINNKYLDIDIINPRTHIKKGKAVYTDYEIHVKTNHPEFALKESRVRRRYSEFVWLKQRLGLNDVMMVTAPSLPGKRYIGRFKDSFLKERQQGLQNFMNKVVEINAFLSEPALHFFLQSAVPIPDMEYHLSHASLLSNIRDVIIQSNEAKERKQRRKMSIEAKCSRLRRSLSLDSLQANTKMTKMQQHPEIGRGRGWSRFIGEGYHSFGYSTPDNVDYGGGSLTPFRQRSITTNACVLPGGKLRPASSRLHATSKAVPVRGLVESRRSRTNRPSSSWHGRAHDMTDFFLDDYDMISQEAVEQAIMSDIESVSTSEKSNSQHNIDSNSYHSSEDGIRNDIMEQLKEYNIISLADSPIFGWDRQPSIYE